MSCHGILIVEDDPDIRESLRDMLEDEGFIVGTVDNGRDALVRMEAEHPCVVLLDLMMPIMSGAEMLAEMSSHEGISAIPVVVVSAWNDTTGTDGAQGIVRKPINIEELLEHVRRHCGDAKEDHPSS
jgi:CheY-like chemotaxis protein